MTLLTKDQILKADDIAHEDVKCPEWGGTLRVKSLSAHERDLFEAGLVVSPGKKSKDRLNDFRASYIARAIIDADGKRLFSDKDIAALSKKSAKPVSRVFDVAQRLSGMTDKDVEELEGN